jgi:hypothetical protein
MALVRSPAPTNPAQIFTQLDCHNFTVFRSRKIIYADRFIFISENILQLASPLMHVASEQFTSSTEFMAYFKYACWASKTTQRDWLNNNISVSLSFAQKSFAEEFVDTAFRLSAFYTIWNFTNQGCEDLFALFQVLNIISNTKTYKNSNKASRSKIICRHKIYVFSQPPYSSSLSHG